MQKQEHVSKKLNWFDSFFDYLNKRQLEHLETTSPQSLTYAFTDMIRP